MRRPGTDDDNVQMSDVLCDFCHAEWIVDLPMVEGHRGSCICGKCLRIAYIDLIVNRADDVERGYTCTLCLTEPDGPAWRSPMYDDAIICRQCVKRSAGVLHKDKDTDWTKPAEDNG